jgi:PTS system nitrogen regulatory IIA component
MRLGSLVHPQLIFPGLHPSDRLEVLRSFSRDLADQGLVGSPEELFGKLLEREQLGSTGIGQGIAIPHCKIKGLKQGIVAVATSPAGVDFGAADGLPVRLFFLVISPSESPAEHLQILAAISRWIKADRHAERLLELSGRDEIFEFLQEEGR